MLTETSESTEQLQERILSLGRAALVIAHPSHELRIHGWLALAQPQVFIWTDGSGRSGEVRLGWTTNVLTRAGATRGSIYGPVTDFRIYEAVLNADCDFFIGLADQLALELIEQEFDYVVFDASEGHSVSHEILRLVTQTAISIASLRTGKEIRSYDFIVVGPPANFSEEVKDLAIKLDLDDYLFQRKLEAAQSHHPKVAADVIAALDGASFTGAMRLSERKLAEAATKVDGDIARLSKFPQLLAQINRLFEDVNLESFRKEYLRPADDAFIVDDNIGPPFYELYGEKLVEAGIYEIVIRQKEHLQPIATALSDYAERTPR